MQLLLNLFAFGGDNLEGQLLRNDLEVEHEAGAGGLVGVAVVAGKRSCC